MNTHASDTAKLVLERLEVRRSEVWKNPSPYIKPLWEISEINTKIKELNKLIK